MSGTQNFPIGETARPAKSKNYKTNPFPHNTFSPFHFREGVGGLSRAESRGLGS